MTLMPSVWRYTDPKIIAPMTLTVQTIGQNNLMGLDTIVLTNVRTPGILLDSSQARPSNPVVFRTRSRQRLRITLGRLSWVNQKPTKMAPRAIAPM